MKAIIKDVALAYPSLTIRFHKIYENGVIARVEHNRRLILSDVVKGEGDLQKFLIRAIKILYEKGLTHGGQDEEF